MVHRLIPKLHIPLALAIAAGLPPGAARAIDLTPSPAVEVQDGVRLDRTAFVHRGARVLCDLPSGWSPQGQGRRLDLRPPEGTTGEARIEVVPSLAGTSIDLGPAEMKRRTSELVALFPANVTGPAIGPIRPCEVQMSGRPVYRADGTFVSRSRAYRAIFWLVPSEGEGLRFSLFLIANDQAEATIRSFERSLCSWIWPAPDE